jgi:hypothetical protein
VKLIVMNNTAITLLLKERAITFLSEFAKFYGINYTYNKTIINLHFL